MTDAELLALTALTNQETILMDGENAQRTSLGQSQAYVSDWWGYYHALLHKEMDRRGLIPTEKTVTHD